MYFYRFFPFLCKSLCILYHKDEIAANAVTFSSLMSLPSTTLQPGRRGSKGIITTYTGKDMKFPRFSIISPSSTPSYSQSLSQVQYTNQFIPQRTLLFVVLRSGGR